MRKLKESLAAYLHLAENGESAAIVPFEQAKGLDETERLKELAARGLVDLPQQGLSMNLFSAPRVPSRGKSASKMVLKDRK